MKRVRSTLQGMELAENARVGLYVYMFTKKKNLVEFAILTKFKLRIHTCERICKLAEDLDIQYLRLSHIYVAKKNLFKISMSTYNIFTVI